MLKTEFKNLKTHWINMLSLLKWVMPKYKSFIVKMFGFNKKQDYSRQPAFIW